MLVVLKWQVHIVYKASSLVILEGIKTPPPCRLPPRAWSQMGLADHDPARAAAALALSDLAEHKRVRFTLKHKVPYLATDGWWL